jgi:predicted Ser/Thr protein kinase
VHQVIGHGAIGEVLLAYDPQLARRVALKVIRAGVVSPHARARMVREARALAQLSHPNVVAIYDAGTYEDNVYIAMEYVAGETLATWSEKPRSKREALGVMRQAGRGLAAAHAAGIVHRDFKPANILIADDARVRVLDFGIAFGDPLRDTRLPGTWTPPLDATRNVRGVGGDRLTQEGAIVGTVGYFAPEAIFDQPADGRADIFSFCVTLWRTLTGRLPFPETSDEEYLDAIFREPRERLRDPSVPDWLATAIERGLRTTPADRYATVDELLRALDETEVWKVPAAIGVFALAIAGAATVTLGAAERDAEVGRVCRAEAEAFASSWSSSARDAARRAMLAEPDPSAPTRTERTLARLDTYVRDWQKEQSASCEATLIAKTQPEVVHERRSECLIEERMQFETVAARLAGADRWMHRQSMGAALALAAPRLCAGAAADPTFAPLPAGPRERDAVLSAKRETLGARVMLSVSSLGEAQRGAERAIALAREGGQPAVEARAEHLLGAVFHERSDERAALAHERRAVARAEAVGADHVAGVAAAALAYLLVDLDEDPDEALAWQDLARGKLARLGVDPLLEEAIRRGDEKLATVRDSAGALEASDGAMGPRPLGGVLDGE